MVDILPDGLWVVAQLFWLECIRTAMADPWEAIARGANVPGTASPGDPEQCVSDAPLRQTLPVLVPALGRKRRWRRKAGQPQRAALSLVHRWFSACHTARDTWHRAVVALQCATRLCENAWRDYYQWGRPAERRVWIVFCGRGGAQDPGREGEESRC